MDSMKFSLFVNECIAKVYEEAQAKLREDQAKLDEEKNKVAREQEIRDAEEKARLQAIKDMEEKQKREAERLKLEAENVEKARLQEEKRLADSVKYQAFLEGVKYVPNSKEFFIVSEPNEILVYKLVGTYKK
jgi:hypothetical protein